MKGKLSLIGNATLVSYWSHLRYFVFSFPAMHQSHSRVAHINTHTVNLGVHSSRLSTSHSNFLREDLYTSTNLNMLLEIQIAVSFLTSYLYNKLPRRRVDLFSVELAKRLKEKFDGHWYPDRPSKGSGYRCLLIGDDLDPVLMNAAQDSGLSLDEIRTSLPEKLTMWIDPDEVSYRIEDQLVIKVIYQKDKYGELENLAELEDINNQQLYGVTSTSPTRSNGKAVEASYNCSPTQTSPLHVSPLSIIPNANQTNYSLWSTEEILAPQVDSRLSPNAQEFRYPASKQSPTNTSPRKDTNRFTEYPSFMWSNLTEPIDRRQGYSSLQSLYGWFENPNSYKRSYNNSQLEIMA